MAETKGLSQTVEKWTRVTPQRTQDYETGIKNPKRDWEAATLAGEEIYKTAVIEAAQSGRQGAGVRKAGNKKWQDGAVKKGTARFGPGVQAGADAYNRGMADVIATIERTTLSPKYPRGDPRNISRSAEMAAALHSLRTG